MSDRSWNVDFFLSNVAGTDFFVDDGLSWLIVNKNGCTRKSEVLRLYFKVVVLCVLEISCPKMVLAKPI